MLILFSVHASLTGLNASFHLDAQTLGVMEVVNGANSAGRNSVGSPAFMCPASPASSFSGSNETFPVDENLSLRQPEQQDEEEVDDVTADARTDSVAPVDVGKENGELVEQGEILPLESPEREAGAAAVMEPTAVSVSKEAQGRDDSESDGCDTCVHPEPEAPEHEVIVGAGTDHGVGDNDAHPDTLEVEQGESEGDVGVDADLGVVNDEAVAIAQTQEDDLKEIANVDGQELATSNKDDTLDPAAVSEVESPFPAKEAQEKEDPSEAVTKERSMTGHTEDTASPPSRRTSSNIVHPPPPAVIAEDGYASDGALSTTSSSSQTAAVIVAPQFPSTPLAAATQKPRTGQPMRTPVPSPAGSVEGSAADPSDSEALSIDDTEVEVEGTADTEHEVQEIVVDAGDPGAGVPVSSLPMDELQLDDPEEDERTAEQGEEREGNARDSSLSLKVRGVKVASHRFQRDGREILPNGERERSRFVFWGGGAAFERVLATSRARLIRWVLLYGTI